MKTPPLEVVVVSRREPGPAAARLLTAFVNGFFMATLNALLLMFLLPLAHRVLHTPDLHPGYLDCWLLAYLTRATFAGLFTRVHPLATVKTEP